MTLEKFVGGWALLVPLLFLGCSDALVPDQGEASMSSGYPSLEVYSQGRHFVGLGWCQLEPGQDLSDCGIAVQGYYRGRIRSFVELWGQDTQLSFVGNDPVRIDMSGEVNVPLVVGLTMHPEYPAEDDQAIQVYGSLGYVFVNPAPKPQGWEYHMTKSPEGTDAVVDIPVEGKRWLHVVSNRCSVEREFDVSNLMRREVRLSELAGFDGVGWCDYQMAVVGDGEASFHFWFSSRYAARFKPLSTPSVMVDDDEIRVFAEPNVSVLALDSLWSFAREASFDFDPTVPHRLRALSTKRVVVGDWDPKKRKFEWKK